MLDFNFTFNIFNIIFCVINTTLLCLLGFKFIYAYQICGYKLNHYYNYLKQLKNFVFYNIFLSFLSFLILFLLNFIVSLYNLSVYFTYASMCIYCVFCFVFYKIIRTHTFKVKFNLTRRIIRFIVVYMLICAFITIFTLSLNGYLPICLKFVYVVIIPLFLSQIVAISHLLTIPLESLVKMYYIIKCKIKLKRNKNIKIIALTGSSGKTSTKFILEEMLKQKYNVLSTPQSYNTTMGLTKTINNNNLSNIDYLILEFGADRKNDIKKLCRIAPPDYSFVTNIGNQHLKTFKTQTNITKTKCQIYTYLKKNGIAFFNIDDKNVYEFSKKYSKPHFNISSNEECFLKISNIQTTNSGSTFILSDGTSTKKCKTVLLGEHNIQNIFASSCIAYKLHINLNLIQNAIANLQPTPHRLQLISSNPRLTVLDDTFNSNYEGFKQALNVLSKFDGNKAVVTPGIVELGKEQEKINYNIGVIIANVCTKVIIVNKTNKTALYSGLIDAGFSDKNIFFYNTLEDAQNFFSVVLSDISTVLLENDLPDDYV